MDRRNRNEKLHIWDPNDIPLKLEIDQVNGLSRLNDFYHHILAAPAQPNSERRFMYFHTKIICIQNPTCHPRPEMLPHIDTTVIPDPASAQRARSLSSIEETSVASDCPVKMRKIQIGYRLGIVCQFWTQLIELNQGD